MTIAVAFTVTAIIATFLHGWYFSRVIRNRIAVKNDAAYIRAVALAHQRVETARFLINLLMAIAGVGVIVGGPFRYLGYLLATLPILSVIASAIALRGL